MKLDFKFSLKEKNMPKRVALVVIAVIFMGFALSLLLQVGWGTDPCTAMNKAIAGRLGWSIGNWQALFNTALLVLVVIFGGQNLGWGTLANMFLVGYSIDFFTWVWKQCLDMSVFENPMVKVIVFIPSLIIFVLSAAVYMDVDTGTAPYDALCFIIASHLKKVPFVVVRIAYDFAVIAVGIICGGKLELATVCMAVLLGPAVAFVGKKIDRFL